jgi:hypothetical protein
VEAKLAATNTDNQRQHLRVLSAESAAVGGVLGDFHLLDHLTQSSAISGAVLAANSDLLGVVSLHETTAKLPFSYAQNEVASILKVEARKVYRPHHTTSKKPTIFDVSCSTTTNYQLWTWLGCSVDRGRDLLKAQNHKY